MRKSTLYMAAALGLLFAFSQALRGGTHDKELQPSFQTSDRCFACHNGMTDEFGQRLFPRAGCRLRNGQLRPRSVLAGRRTARNHRPSGVEGRHRRRVFDLPHAGRALRSQAARSERGSVLALAVRSCKETGCAGGRRSDLLGMPPDFRQGTGTPGSYVGNFVMTLHPPEALIRNTAHT